MGGQRAPRAHASLLSHPISDTLLAGVRRVAARFPYHVGAWTLCRLLDSRGPGTGERGGPGAAGSFSTSFRKAVIRYQARHSDSLPLLMLVANECLLGRSYRYATGCYFEAYRLAPAEPLISLCLAVSYFGQVMSRVTSHRHCEAARAFAFLARYGRLRLQQSEAVYGGGHEESSSSSSSRGALHTGGGAGGGGSGEEEEEGGTETEAGVGTGTGAGAPGMQACVEVVPASDPYAAHALPPALPPTLARAEYLYNLGRACHQLSVTYIAVQAYQDCLAVQVAPSQPPVHVHAGTDVRREAAYNLCLILKGSGSTLQAARLTAQYLTYD